jgi:hypothetical protein
MARNRRVMTLPGSWNNEQVHDGNVRRVITQEVSHLWLGGVRRFTMYLATLDCAI